MKNQIRFNNSNRDFYTTLRKRVDAYFTDNKINRQGNMTMYIKSAVMFGVYFGIYFLFITNSFHNYFAMIIGAIILGVAMAGIGLSVMHDANHGSYSSNPSVNKIMSWSLFIVGGYPLNWQIQHNNIHHTFTNVNDVDEDIMPPTPLLRFSPHDKLRAIHRFQYIYAWVLYGLMTMIWATTKDFKQLLRYTKEGHYATKKMSFTKGLLEIIMGKVFYHGYMLVIPLFLMDIVWWQILIGLVIMNFVAGVILAAIFQPAHVVPNTEYPLPLATTNTLENDWGTNQLLTTNNFAASNKSLSWYVGGLNYQVEHHLFPNVCHVHYAQLSKIVEQTAHEFNLPYNTIPTFFGALREHTKMLRTLGKA
ncbi:MAG: acyl-CoA desaturase [Bacteroidia bacterium]|nr:acyl-CoA desaturase [Bacteroidia bacterium]